jgi:hypothetical protein
VGTNVRLKQFRLGSHIVVEKQQEWAAGLSGAGVAAACSTRPRLVDDA